VIRKGERNPQGSSSSIHGVEFGADIIQDSYPMGRPPEYDSMRFGTRPERRLDGRRYFPAVGGWSGLALVGMV